MKHKEVIIAMANDEAVQWKSIQLGEWQDTNVATLNPITHSGYDWRIKPKTIRVGNRDLPEPMRVAPADGTCFYVVSTASISDPPEAWNGYTSQERWLRRGLLHSTKEAAEQWRDAFIELAGGEV